MVDQMRNRQRAPRAGGGPGAGAPAQGSGDPMQDIYGRVMAILNDGVVDENEIATLSQLWSMQNAYSQQQQFDLQQRGFDVQNRGYDAQMAEYDYRMDYNNFLRDELGYKGDQLAFAREQFEFQSGPEFEFYKQERQLQHDATMLGHQSAMQQSKDDVLRSANYLQQQRLGTEAAGYNRDIARFQAMQAMGVAPDPRNPTIGSLAKLTMGY